MCSCPCQVISLYGRFFSHVSLILSIITTRTNGTIVDNTAEHDAKALNCGCYAGFIKREDLARELRENVASRQLKDFAVIYPYDERIKQLASLCMDNQNEWSFNRKDDYFILKNYLNYTFMKLDVEEKIFDCLDGRKYFNTGLFAKGYRKIYAVFEPNKNGNERMFLTGFFTEDNIAKFGIRTSLDDRANYFTEPRRIIFNPSLEIDINLNHIVGERFGRCRKAYHRKKASCSKTRNNAKLSSQNALNALRTKYAQTTKW